MAVLASRRLDPDTAPVDTSPPSQHIAHRAAARASHAGGLLGGLGLASAGFVVLTLLETWRITPGASPHHLSVLGWRLSYPAANAGAIVVLILALVGSVVTSIAVAQASREARAARRFVQRLDGRICGLVSDAWVIDGELPQAFCAGLLRPRIFVSEGAVAALDESALEVVLGHERHHARRRDPLRLATGRVLTRALFFVPGLRQLHAHQQTLAELSADESAVNATPDGRSALARAILGFVGPDGGSGAGGFDPRRVDFLLGESPNWRFPVLLSAAAAGVIGLTVATGILAGRAAAGAASLAPPLLSHQPCVVVLASIPALAAVFTLRLGRRQRPAAWRLSGGRAAGRARR
jgi:hypothetical protein